MADPPVSVPSTAPCSPNRPPTIQISGQAGRRTGAPHSTATITASVTASATATAVPDQPGPGCTTAHRTAGPDTAGPQTNLVSAAAASEPAPWAAR
nr:hypothetical protein [Nucisporomicrobium flavum]